MEAVRRIYDAYGRNDVDAVLADLADNVDWAAEAASSSVPWFGSFHPVSFTSNETDVIVAVHWA